MTMPASSRVDELFGGDRKTHRVLTTPEGVPLRIDVAGNGERLGALVLDLIFIGVASGFLSIIGFILMNRESGIGYTLFAFMSFLVQNAYFIFYELAWQGRTPGKKICGLRVINRTGGELSPGAVIARNLTRQVEVFLPLGMWFTMDAGALGNLAILGWATVLGSLPLWNRDRLRAGDLIGGTMVVSMPARILLPDLAETARDEGYRFTPAQLSIYGAFELQVLEELLRRPPGDETERGLLEVSRRIRRKIGWDEELPEHRVRRWLTDFYTAERAELERGKLYGRLREDKTGAVRKP